MKGFNFEKNLPHQQKAVESVLRVFENAEWIYQKNKSVNPLLDFEHFPENVKINEENIKINKEKNIIDIQMETGTGKTYTYTKTMFELNKHYGISKFIVVVPTLSIKAGTINFFQSESSVKHFRMQYQKELKCYVVESQSNKKSKKPQMPGAIKWFCQDETDKDTIKVLIINAGMINSKTMSDFFDTELHSNCYKPFDAIAYTRSFMIVDEPHKFDKDKKTWGNLLKMNPQIILRYGATFTQTENLVYKLSAVEAFSENLVKGVVGHITQFEEGKNILVKFVNSDGKEASFDVIDGMNKKNIKISKSESLVRVHPKMVGLSLDKINKSEIELSNGIVMRKNDKINPYSYDQSLQEMMIQKAIKKHFEIEKYLLTREVRIKPLTLFFIDNIEQYRNENGALRLFVEECVKNEVENLLKTETHAKYKEFLKKTIKSIKATHCGYFSRDNSDKDEDIEQEIKEILHDKQIILSLDNTRRFIFSKWTLREGWDNPNVFQICKLRSSGSEISKLQEVGRGLRLPVNEYGNREKNEQFHLNYFVDFTETDFIDKLTKEINDRSGVISYETPPENLQPEMIDKIAQCSGKEKVVVLKELEDEGIIDRSNKFIRDDGWKCVQEKYPEAFRGVDSSKVRKYTQEPKKITVRIEKYKELKQLWEKLNEKVILIYNFENENQFKEILKSFFRELKEKNILKAQGVYNRVKKVVIQSEEKRAYVKENISALDDVTPISTMLYSDFVKELAKVLNVNLITLHQTFTEEKENIDINQYLNPRNIRIIKQKFNEFLIDKAFTNFQISYENVSANIHPTKLTDKNGEALGEVNPSDIGVSFEKNLQTSENYYFKEVFYDSELEKKNIALSSEINEVEVFTKIPKNSIKIPVSGGGSYSPDFAYVLKDKNGNSNQINFLVVETKGVNSCEELRSREKQKIDHAKKFFENIKGVKVSFKTQFNDNEIAHLIKEVFNNEK